MKRFLIVDDYKHYGLDNEEYIPKSAWLLDYAWFNAVDTEINEWLTKYGCIICIMPGMIIKFPDKETMTLFLLKWQ
jgi:hypothetical protein